MAVSFKFYHDSALTSEITSGNPLTAIQDAAGLLGAVDKIIYFGSTISANQIQAASDPGTDAIVVSIADANAGTGSPAAEFKLALSSGGLAGATAGASLSLSHTVPGGVANAVPIHTRRDSALTVAGTYTDLTLTTVNLEESTI
jgi:hypothetical protein